MKAFLIGGDKLKKFLFKEEGWVVAYFAVLLPIFLLFGALGLDYGRAFVLKHQLQSACDAASLAGASAATAKFIVDGFGNPVGEKLVLDPIIAEIWATDVWNQNVVSLNFASKGVAIVDTSNHIPLDSDSDGYLDSYRWGVTATIQSFLAGPITGTGNTITVTRSADSKLKEP